MLTLIVWGEADGTFRKGEGLLFVQNFLNHQLCLLRAKHFMREHVPEEINAVIKK